jgi:hypothetical protein
VGDGGRESCEDRLRTSSSDGARVLDNRRRRGGRGIREPFLYGEPALEELRNKRGAVVGPEFV